MQITIQLIGEHISLPIASSESIQGLLYKAISEDRSYSTKVHEEGRCFDGRKYKLFTFGEPEGRYMIQGTEIVYLNGMRLRVRSLDPYFIQLLFAYFTKHEQVWIGNNNVKVGKVTLNDDRIFEDRIVIRTLSPITAYVTGEDGHTVYYSPKDDNFYNSLITNAKRKWGSVYGDAEVPTLCIRGVEDARYIKRATRFKSTYITAWHGTFVLEGAPQILDFLYQVGLGSKNSQGFGMFEVTERGPGVKHKGTGTVLD